MYLLHLTPQDYRILNYFLIGIIFALLNFMCFNEGSNLMFNYLNITIPILNNYIVNFILDILTWPLITFANLSFDYNTFLFIIINIVVVYLAYKHPGYRFKIDYSDN